MRFSGKVLGWLLIPIGGVFALAATGLWRERPPTEVYQSFASPDHRFKIIVAEESSLLGGMLPKGPGQGADFPGLVFLVDVERDRVLKKKRIALASAVKDVDWSATNVSVRFFTEWDLPPR